MFDGFGAVRNVPANKGVEWLRVFNGNIYAAVGQDESGSGNPYSLWRSSDLTNWTPVGPYAGAFSNADVDVYSIETDGTSSLFAGVLDDGHRAYICGCVHAVAAARKLDPGIGVDEQTCVFNSFA